MWMVLFSFLLKLYCCSYFVCVCGFTVSATEFTGRMFSTRHTRAWAPLNVVTLFFSQNCPLDCTSPYMGNWVLNEAVINTFYGNTEGWSVSAAFNIYLMGETLTRQCHFTHRNRARIKFQCAILWLKLNESTNQQTNPITEEKKPNQTK